MSHASGQGGTPPSNPAPAQSMNLKTAEEIVWANQRSGPRAGILATAIGHNESLRKLSLQSCVLPSNVPKAIATKMRTPNNCLVALELIAQEGLWEDGWVRQIFKSMAFSSCLTSLHLERNGLTPTDAEWLGKALMMNTTVTELGLAGNKLLDHGEAVISHALAWNTTLRSLDLSSNNIIDAAGLPAAMMINTTLRDLNLSGNLLSNLAASNLAGALRRNKSLQTLGLACGSLHGSSVVAIANACRVMPALTDVDLSDSGITPEAAAAVADLMRHTATLKAINLGGESNWLDFDSLRAVGIALHDNWHLPLSFTLTGFNLNAVWKALGTPEESSQWTNAQFVMHFSMHHSQSRLAFALVLHPRLGKASPVAGLTEEVIRFICWA